MLSQCQDNSIPYVNDSFTEEVLPQIQSRTFLYNYVENSNKILNSIDDSPWIILNTSIRSALVRLSSKDHNH